MLRDQTRSVENQLQILSDKHGFTSNCWNTPGGSSGNLNWTYLRGRCVHVRTHVGLMGKFSWNTQKQLTTQFQKEHEKTEGIWEHTVTSHKLIHLDQDAYKIGGQMLLMLILMVFSATVQKLVTCLHRENSRASYSMWWLLQKVCNLIILPHKLN